MITDTSIVTTTSGHLNGLQAAFTISPQELYQRFRVMAAGLTDLTHANIYYRVMYNDQDSFNGCGVHEKFIYNGMSIIDVSIGLLDFPWYAADANANNEISLYDLQLLANNELDPVVSPRLRAIAVFAEGLPMHVHYYHYVGRDGIRALTIEDPFNNIKFNCILTHQLRD